MLREWFVTHNLFLLLYPSSRTRAKISGSRCWSSWATQVVQNTCIEWYQTKLRMEFIFSSEGWCFTKLGYCTSWWWSWGLELQPLLSIPYQQQFPKNPKRKKKEIGIGVQVSDFKMTNSIIRRCHGQTNKASCTFGSNCKSCYLGLWKFCFGTPFNFLNIQKHQMWFCQTDASTRLMRAQQPN